MSPNGSFKITLLDHEATGEHFNLSGHSMAHMKVTILKKVKSQGELYRKERELFHIKRFDTFYRGIKKKPK